MVGFYKLIDENGCESDIPIDSAKSEKEIYRRYFGNASKDNKEVKIESLSYSPIYYGKDLDVFVKIKETIEKNLHKYLEINEIKTPNIIENSEEIKELQKLFGLDQFICNNDYILPPASDFGVFSWLKGKTIEESKLPYAIYEFAKCYRIEDKEKQTNVLKRPTSFHLPDIHVFLKNNIYEEALKHFIVYGKILEELGISYDPALRITEKEYSDNKETILEFTKKINKKMVVNIVPSSIKYWESKFKYIYKDGRGEFVQLSTAQADYRTAKLFDIKIGGEYAEILHSSVGSMERLMYAYLDK